MTEQHDGLVRARTLLYANRPQDALRELAVVPEQAATSPTAFVLRTFALTALERWAEAVEAARAGLTIGGPDPELLGQLGRSLRELGDRPGAERALLDGLAMAPRDVYLLCQYAQLCIAAGQLPKAAELVRLAAAEQPEDGLVYSTRAQLAYAMGNDREARRIGREFVAAHPEDPAAHATLGGMDAVRGDTGAAYERFRQATAAVPDNEELGEAAMELRIARHPVFWPVRPFLRFGIFKPWLVVVVTLTALRAGGLGALAGVLGLGWMALCIYSWVVPPLFRRAMMRRWRRTAPQM